MSTLAIRKVFCTTREAAILLGVSVGTVQLWVESGLLEAWKTAGGHRRVLRDSVERLLHKAPVQPPREVPVAAHATPPEAHRRLKVLVVEDDVHLLRLYQAKLSAWPLVTEITTSNNAFAGLLMMGRMNPDLLITDLQMPGMDGFEMLKVLRKAPEAERTKIVVVSGLDPGVIASKGGIPSDVELLSKPVPFDRLQTIALALAAK